MRNNPSFLLLQKTGLKMKALKLPKFLTLPLIYFADNSDLEEYQAKESMTYLVNNASLYPDNMT
jgi:hypothetical protein